MKPDPLRNDESGDTPEASERPVGEETLPDDPAEQWLKEEIPPATRGQFRITTLLTWTTVVALLFGSVNFAEAGTNVEAWALLLVLFGPPLTCVPILVDHLTLKHRGLEFSGFWQVWMTFCVGIYSCCMLMLATVAFSPNWKGSKGLHWGYYLLDGYSGMTLWPIYFAGAMLFIHGLLNSIEPRYKVIYLLGSVTCAFISFWYFAASVWMNFTMFSNESARPNFMFVPLAAGVCYSLYAAIILRQKEYKLRDVVNQKAAIGYWIGSLLVSIAAKYPLANNLYLGLADEPPEECFVVTAATRGHPRWVGTWYDEREQRWLNRQLLTFWKFEDRLRASIPGFHRCLRRVYNRVGPFIARRIVYRWQADCVYALLKPLEWLVRSWQ